MVTDLSSTRQSDQGVAAHPSERWAILKVPPPAGGEELGSSFPGVSEGCVPTVRLNVSYHRALGSRA